ncbi:MAG: hypothetical protein J6S71_01275 [Clostridia bacterium]|nr:hypothetical protein [Clostridia bacterium]
MKKKLTFFSFIPSIIICVILNVILFLTVPSLRLASPVFWIAWTFTFPINITIAVLIWIYIHTKKMTRNEDTITYLPLVTYIILIATGVYLVSGIALMYPPVKFPIVAVLVDGIITCIYGLALYYAFFIANRISDTQKETKQEILYIRLLQSDLESCFYNVKDEALLSKLRKLSEQIRFSDPISHPSLDDCEAEISKAVKIIVRKACASEFSDIEEDITKASSLLEYRNSRCKLLK